MYDSDVGGDRGPQRVKGLLGVRRESLNSFNREFTKTVNYRGVFD